MNFAQRKKKKKTNCNFFEVFFKKNTTINENTELNY